MIHILIAEDHPDNFDMLRRRLERKGFCVSGAVNGKIAVDMAHEAIYDLVLMDMGMPIMSGLDATRALRASKHTQNIPIIALTAHAMESDRKNCLEAGCDAFATKPIDFKLLFALIDKTLKARIKHENVEQVG